MTTWDTTLSEGTREQDARPATDRALLARIAQGDERAFATLYRRYHVPLYNYLLRLIHRGTVAEELLQDTFLAVWEGAAGFRGQAKVKTWLFRIAHHRAVSWLRRKREAFTHDGELPDHPVPPQTEAQAMTSWRVEQLRAALDKLTPEHRAVLELAFFHEMSYAEIAEVLGCPLGTVKSRMSYARRILTGHLKAQGVTEG